MPKLRSSTITIGGIELFVEYEYTPEEPMVWTYSNGDPGHPGTPAQIDIVFVWLGDNDISDLLYALGTFPKLEEAVGEVIDENEADKAADKFDYDRE